MLRADIDARKLETLIEINTLINSNYSDLHALLARILESATRLTEGSASSLLLLHPENDRLYFEVALGTKGPDVKKFSLAKGEGIAGWVAEHNTSLIVNDVDHEPRFFADISRQIGFPTSSILAVPMRIKGECVGVIELINKQGDKIFTQDDLDWLEIFSNQASIALQNARSFQQARDEIHLLQSEIRSEQSFHPFIFRSRAVREKMDIVERIAPTDSSVLILGESGVGKELFAEQIHLRSLRAKQPFIRVNCAAIPESLLESELFGHVRGAFTDATSERRGRFELADGGTIFLDEIGEIPLAVQVKLMRVIQQRTFEKVGSSESMHVDVRIIAATNRDIEQAVEQGTFRKDLYYRLNVLPLWVPPLRQRADDIIELARFFLKRFNRETKKSIRGFNDDALELLLSYPWPGNVRELENAVERAVVIGSGDLIRPADLVLGPGSTGEGEEYAGKNLKEAVNLFKKHFITRTLEKHRWNQTETAKELGIQRTYLSRLIRELDIRN